MTQRPLSITVFSWVFIAAGSLGFLYHVADFRTRPSYELVWVCLLRLLAILGGVFMLRGRNWARWLLVLWMVYHVVLSAFHSAFEAGFHLALLGVVLLFLFRPGVSAYFKKVAGH